MMSEKKFDITELQWIALIVGTLIGIGITTLPRELVEEAGRDGWITLLVGTMLVLIYARVCLYYSELFPSMTLAESVQMVLGKWLGILTIVLYSVYTFAVSGVVLRSYLEIIHVYFDVLAPAPYKSILGIIVVVYIARCGMATLCRVGEIIFLLTIPFLFLLISPIFHGNVMHVLPVFEGNVSDPFLALPVVGFAFLGVETVILVFYPYLEKKETAHRVTYMGIAFTGILYTLIFLTTLLVMGLEQIPLFFWPFVEVLKTIRVAIIERIDNIFLYFWAAKITIVIAIQYFGGTFSLAVLTKKKYHDIWAVVCWPAVIVVSVYPDSLVELGEIAELISKWGGIFVLTLPVVLIIVSKIRGVDGGKNKKNKDSRNKKAS